MTRFEYLAVLRSMDTVADLGTKEDIQKLIKKLIADAEVDKTKKNVKE